MKESEFQELLGVSRDKLRWLRRGLEAGVHFVKEGRSVVYTDAGQDEVRRLIAAELGATPAEPETGDRPQTPEDRAAWSEVINHVEEPVIEELRVVRRVLNPRIVFCKRAGGEGEKGLQRVMVRNSEHFLPGMLLRAQRVNGSGDLWTLVGRCPRWRGRW